MLSDEERREIEAEIAHYPQKRAVCIDAMSMVQRHRGWISDETLADIAAFLDMTADELDGVATFYNLIFRKPVGRHVILICDSVSCWLLGYNQMKSHLRAELGHRPGRDDQRRSFTLLPSSASAPATRRRR